MHAPIWPSTLAAETSPVDRDGRFFQRPPNGHFRFRTLSGDYIDRAITGVSQLGQEMAATDDYYVCAAKRYFHYFTGIDVPLFDPGDPTAPTLSEVDQAYQEMVIQLGRELRQSQSLRTLIQRILSTSLYGVTSMRLPAEEDTP